ncbi:MAG: imidazolonepropionase [Marinicaulis sp.]|nr:imidazolonepropionase [Marinicaulis sp.]NNE40079.1 imidazolonepropionase [Marinicaulis sp.]NNL88434.1 imidazolonepropionase [Marinicaulis sp.]
MWDKLWFNGRIATADPAVAAPYGMITDGAVGVKDGVVVWVGKTKDIAADIGDAAEDVINLDGSLMTPGLIDCHTHLVYNGDRATEFEARLQGKSYEEIARAGGGIISTVNATRTASEDELEEQSLHRLKALMNEGVTRVEIKSGYGLDTDNEIKILRVAKRLGAKNAVSVSKTFLGAHALPPEFAGDADGYIDHVCEEMLPAAHAAGLVDAVDGFCEGIGFSRAQIERVFKTAKSLGLPVKLHAEQLSDLGGSGLAAEYTALSADHLEYLNDNDIHAMATAGTIAVLLPGAFYFLRETKLPPVDGLRAAKVPVAIATDCNPGTSPLSSILMAMNMASSLFRLTPEESFLGVTRNAAKALGINDEGVIKPGAIASLAIWDVDHPARLTYAMGDNRLRARIFKGQE